MRSNPRSINGRTHLLAMLDILPRSDLGAPLPLVAGNLRFSRCICTENSSYDSRARGWSDLCRVSLLHAMQCSRSLCSASAWVKGTSIEANGRRDKEGTSFSPSSVVLHNLQAKACRVCQYDLVREGHAPRTVNAIGHAQTPRRAKRAPTFRR